MSDALWDALGYVGDSLDKPGRAVRGVLAGKGREALAAVPFSDTMGLTDHKQRTSGRDLTDMYGLTDKYSRSFGSSAAGFGAEMLTDPLNVLGGYAAYKAAPTVGKGLVGAGKALTGLDLIDSLHKGGRSAATLGRDMLHGEDGWMHLPPWGSPDSALSRAADAAGPRYPGGPDKLKQILDYANPHDLMNHDFIESIAHEIPEGSTWLSKGSEAFAVRTPEGGVIRIGPTKNDYGHNPRPDIPEILQPYRSTIIGEQGNTALNRQPWQVEHLPYVSTPGLTRADSAAVHALTDKIWGAASRTRLAEQGGDLISRLKGHASDLSDYGNDSVGMLSHSIESRNPHLEVWDGHAGNIALTNEDKLIGHDGGMVRGRDKFMSPERGLHTPLTPEELNGVLRAGGPEEIRRLLAVGQSAGTVGQGISPRGFNPAALREHRSALEEMLMMGKDRANLEEMLRRAAQPVDYFGAHANTIGA